MIPALLLFSKLIAWALVLTQSAVVVLVTVGRWTETPMDRLKNILYGRVWVSRAPSATLALVSAAWLYATWGV